MSKVAIVQLRASTHKEDNLRSALSYIVKAKSGGADLVAFPEFLMAYSPPDQAANELASIAEPIEGAFTFTLKEAARKNSITVIATIYERSSIKNRVYDTALLINKAGKISSVYRKLHLYDALGFRESAKLAAGKELTRPSRTNIGSVGMMICYDVRFPEMSRMLALMGADILVIPSAWVQGEMKVEHWQTMLKARAIENGCYVVAPDQVGNIYVGHSMVVDPFGKVVIDMEEKEGFEAVQIDNKLVRDVRKKLPLLRNRRRDVYTKYLTK
ncbi:MAG: carbon-nitrogen hydrolase family protein [Nitrososphaerales archaeon]